MCRHKRRRTNMTLREMLETIPNGSIIKIGSKIGFMYCYYKNENSEAKINELDISNLEMLNRCMLKNATKGKDKLVARYQTKIKCYKPLLDRYVVKCYQTEIENNTYIIIVKGTEQGGYWCIDEYAKKNNLFIDINDKTYARAF